MEMQQEAGKKHLNSTAPPEHEILQENNNKNFKGKYQAQMNI